MAPSATSRRSPPSTTKATPVASYPVVIYLATALPAVGVGVLAQLATLSTAILVFAYIVMLICLAGLASLITELRFRRTASNATAISKRRSTPA